MGRPRPLPEQLGRHFTVQDAAAVGVNRGRLRRTDLETPFRGVRLAGGSATVDPDLDPYERQAIDLRIRARQYAPRLRDGQFFSHQTAIALLGGPQPLIARKSRALAGSDLPVHVATIGSGPLVRAVGVRAHRAPVSSETFTDRDGSRIASPSTVWAQSGEMSLLDLVALGDYFYRVWREGVGRRDIGRPPLTTREELRGMLTGARRVGIRRLREALDLIREDSWSPRESRLRCHLVLAGLPEPILNHDVHDRSGRFIGCVDLAYPQKRIAIEYQSILHHDRYSADVERIAALRAAGWTVIEVTSDLLARPEVLVERVRQALGP
ncbi:hypothetical protein [Microbacterium maritypicum]